ncbi:EAL domain-containing protein [Catenovulum sediminis]|uniref:EAL domain-containing protein n=1 Tax=Catenovulum sediminis TaxID=1740262 RepID=A0ABV1RNM1_9ALTE
MMRDQVNGYHPIEALSALSRQAKVGSEYVNPGLEPGIVWLRTDFFTPESLDLVVELHRAKAEKLTVFLVEHNHQGADNLKLLPLYAQPHHSPLYEFTSTQNTHYSLLVKLENSVSTFKPLLWHHESYIRESQLEFLSFGLFFGVLICLAIYNLIIFFAVRRQAYIWYAAYISTLVIWRAALYGVGGYLGIPHYQAQVNVMVPFVLLDMLFAFLFCIHFLETARHTYRLDKLLHAACWIIGIATLISTTLPIHITAAFVVLGLLIGAPLCVAAGIYCWNRGIRTARFYVASWVPLLIGAIVVQMALWEVIDSTHFTQNFIEVTILLEAFLMSLALADKLRQTEQEKIHLATHDPLTKLPNRNLVQLGLESFKSRVGFTLLQVKLTNLDDIRARLGLKVANAVLCICIERVNEWARSQRRAVTFEMLDLEPQKLGQLEHGVMVMAFRGTHVSLNELTGKISELITKSIDYKGISVNLKSHIGASVYPHHSQDIIQLIENTSYAIFEAQKKDLPVVAYTEDGSNRTKQRLAMMVDLRDALVSGNQLSLFIQPKISLTDNKVVGGEILLRWFHPKFGAIEPEEFIPLAEDAGLITDVTLWVLAEAVQINKIICEVIKNHHIAVNIRACDLLHESFIAQFTSILETNAVPRRSIYLEISESELHKNVGLIHLKMERLHQLGLLFSIDDFASDHVSLAQLANMPIREIKLDEYFVHYLDTDSQNQKLLKLVKSVSASLNADLLAEGVEDLSVLSYIQQQGVSKAQGYALAPPMSVSDYLLWIEKRNE